MWECAIDKGITVRGNATRLQRAVAVLLDNACKYTNAGGTVTVTLRAHASEAVLSVRNSGEPIDEADLPHLFDRFYRADAARTHNAADAENNGGEPGADTGGYGLGLAIARDIAQAHKGTIAVTSTAQEGARLHPAFALDVAPITHHLSTKSRCSSGAPGLPCATSR